MICPLEGHECQCDVEDAGICPPCRTPPPPPPTLAEIERLVDAYGVAGGGAENKAALMAAIEKYGAQNGKT